MRCAVLEPTPGRHLSACNSSSISGSFTAPLLRPGCGRSRQGESRRHQHAAGQAGHLFLADLLNPVDGIVERRCNQVLQHFHVVASAGIDVNSAHFVAAAQGDLDHAAAGLARDLQVGQFGLRLLEAFLHFLRLLHQLCDVAFHCSLRVLGSLCESGSPRGLAGRTEPGTISASNFSCMRLTTGSSATAASASACALARSSLSIRAGVSRSSSSLTGLKSMLRSSPEYSCSALARLALNRSVTSIRSSRPSRNSTRLSSAWPTASMPATAFTEPLSSSERSTRGHDAGLMASGVPGSAARAARAGGGPAAGGDGSGGASRTAPADLGSVADAADGLSAAAAASARGGGAAPAPSAG